jgi:hypothetical protein
MIKLIKPLLSVLLVASIAFLSSCGEDDPKPKTKTELLSAHVWKMTKMKVTVGTTSVEDVPEACAADDTETFESDGDYKFDEGATKCDPDDPQSGTGKWAFKSDETKLEISGSDGGVTVSYAFTILELTETKLRLKWDFVTDQTYEVTYEPK